MYVYMYACMYMMIIQNSQYTNACNPFQLILLSSKACNVEK